LFTAKEQLKKYRQSVLKWAFEGKLTEEWRKDTRVRIPAAPLEGNIAAEPEVEYVIQKKYSLDKVELPEGWKWVKIEDVAKVGTGATPLKSKAEYYGGNISWVTSGALNEEYVREATDFVTEKAVKETNLSVYPKRTLLVAMYGEGKTRGKCSELLIEACTNQAIAAISFDDNDISIKPYLKYFLLKNYQDVRKKSSGGVQPNLNLGIIKKLKFPLPLSIEEQNKIVEAIESRLSVSDKMEESITQSLQQAEALKQSILKKAFEGKLLNEKQEFAKIIPIQRKVLASWIIHLNYDHKYFGLTKFQKTLYLCEQYAQVEYETKYEQERAGPYDREFTLAFRKEITESDIFQEETKVSLTHFIPGLHSAIYSKDYPKYFRNKGNKIKFVLQLLKDKTLNEAELIATIYAVWNNMIILKKAYDISAIIEGVYDWSPEKTKYSKEDISSTLEWMKEKNFVPVGFGKIIK
jgi:hypothetical protein